MAPKKILLATLNARYFHASLGLRCLYANLGSLQEIACIREFTIDQRPIEICEQLLAENPHIVGIGVYIWNIEQTRQLVALLRRLRPKLLIVLGGPEVSYEYENQPVVDHADHVLTGQADLEFPGLCRQLLKDKSPADKVIHCRPPALADLESPYPFYSQEDIELRFIYVEASRGCPFKCEFCLSSLDRTAYAFDLPDFLHQMQSLFTRGVRHFKFIDRTFNLKTDNSVAILEFFLERMDEKVFLHFEVVPDHLPEALKAVIARFPAGSLQFEIGIQTFNEQTQQLISRRQNNVKVASNLQWIRQESAAHIHADLIFGLPGESLQDFAESFDRLISLQPHEIQLGILKRLKGTPIIRHTAARRMVYSPEPPYEILCHADVDFSDMQRIKRFARYWDLVANSGRFPQALGLILAGQPFTRFLCFSDWLYKRTGKTHQIALNRLFDLLYESLLDVFLLSPEVVFTALQQDFQRGGFKGLPKFLQADSNSGDGGSRRKGKRKRQHQHAGMRIDRKII